MRGQFDSGADDNYISRSLILRAGLEHLIEDPASHLPLTVSTVIGEGTLTERLHLNLSLHGSSRSDTLLFWVSEEGTFDLLIGDGWMQKNERNVFGRRAFAAGHESRLVFKPQDKGTPPSHPYSRDAPNSLPPHSKTQTSQRPTRNLPPRSPQREPSRLRRTVQTARTYTSDSASAIARQRQRTRAPDNTSTGQQTATAQEAETFSRLFVPVESG